jgi:hypothetical protein
VGGTVLALVGRGGDRGESDKHGVAAGAAGGDRARLATDAAPVQAAVASLGASLDAAGHDPDILAIEPTVARIEEPPPPKARPRIRRPEPRAVDKEPRTKNNGASAAPAEDPSKKVHAKFRAVSREYRSFRKSYGARLEAEWADLATYAQFARSADKLRVLDRRIDEFRARMRKARQ